MCIQISQHFSAIGADIFIKVSVLVGGIDPQLQLRSLKNNPHIVIGTPGRILFHI